MTEGHIGGWYLISTGHRWAYWCMGHPVRTQGAQGLAWDKRDTRMSAKIGSILLPKGLGTAWKGRAVGEEGVFWASGTF